MATNEPVPMKSPDGVVCMGTDTDYDETGRFIVPPGYWTNVNED